MGQLVFVQLSLESEGPAADVTVELVRVLAVLRPLVLHSSPITGKYCSTFPPTGVGLDARVAVQVPLHVTVDKEPFTTNITGVSHVSGVFAKVLLEVLLLAVLPTTSWELALEPQVTRLHFFHFLPDPFPNIDVNWSNNNQSRYKYLYL